MRAFSTCAFLSRICIAALCVAMLSGCPKRPEEPAAPTPETTATPTTPAAPSAPAAAKPQEPVAAPAPSAPVEKPVVAKPPSEPSPIEKAPSFDPSAPNRACKTDSDCAVKDVGNCCGYFPMCVNNNAKTDPAAVRAQCAKDGMASICGFQDVQGCQCVKGRCENLADGAAIM